MKSIERIIEVKGLSVMVHIGVPVEERAIAQRLLLDLRFAAMDQPEDLHDKLALTVDYFALSQRVEQICSTHPRNLIETLVDDITKIILSEFSLRWIELTARKFILPNTEYVAVTLRKNRL